MSSEVSVLLSSCSADITDAVVVDGSSKPSKKYFNLGIAISVHGLRKYLDRSASLIHACERFSVAVCHQCE